MTTDSTQSTAPGPSHPAPAGQPPRRGGALRAVKWIALAMLLLIVVGGVVLYMSINGIVKSQVEKQSAASLNVPTDLGSANVSLLGGNVTLNDFRISQPQGYQAPHLITLGGIDVGAKLSELRQDPLRVQTITIRQPKMVIEMKGRDFNIKQFIDQLPPGDPKPADNSEPMKLIINDLKVQGAQVIFRPDVQALSAVPGIGQSLGGLKQEYVLSIPDLRMQQIGTGEGNQNGAAIKDIVTLLVQQLASKATQSEQLPPELRQLLNLNVDQITDLAKAKIGGEVNKRLEQAKTEIQTKIGGQAGEAIGGVLSNPQEAAKDPGKAIQQGLGGLLGGKDKQKPATAPATQPK